MSTTINNYDEWIRSLQAKGLHTTNIHNGEANFDDYGNALSTELQQQILDSFDCEEDKELQAQIAALFTDGNVENCHNVIAKCQQMGINVTTSYVKTTYIPDNKADGHYDRDISQASITLYTFSDGKGGEFTVADANGNGSLETEELFINEILTGVASDIAVDASKNVKGNFGSSGHRSIAQILKSGFEDGKTLADMLKELREKREEEEKAKKAEKENQETTGLEIVSSNTYNSLVNNLAQQYMQEMGLANSQAKAKAESIIAEEYVVQ